MPELSTPYAPRIRAPQLIQRAKTQLVSLDIYRDGSKIDFTSGLYSLQDQTGTFILEDVSVNKVDSSAQYTIAASQVPSTTQLSEGWMETWKITIGTTEYTFKRPAYICLSPIYPVISDIDLTTLYPDLANLLPTDETSWQKWIDESWFQVLNRIKFICYILINSISAINRVSPFYALVVKHIYYYYYFLSEVDESPTIWS